MILQNGDLIFVHSLTTNKAGKTTYHAYNINSPFLKHRNYFHNKVLETQPAPQKEKVLEKMREKENSGFFVGLTKNGAKTTIVQTKRRLAEIQHFLEEKKISLV